MTNAELREALKRELAIPNEELKFKHATVDDIGTEFVDYTENGELTLAYPLKPEQRNGYQLLQGGYISVFFDNNFGLFGYVSTGAQPLPTVNMTLNFHKAVLEDTDKLWITTRVTSAGKRILSMSGEARNAAGHLIATCQTNMLNATGARIYI